MMPRFRIFAVALWFAAVPLAAQPVAPKPERMAALRAMSPLVPRAAATSTPLTVNPAAREEVRQFYRAVYAASDGVAMDWTGNYATGAAGDTSAAFKEATRVRINFFRALVGVPATVTLNAAFNSKAQQAALMMSANNTLQHTGIPTTWTFYTAAGAEAAASSNLALGNTGPDAIAAYMRDDGANNAAAGHRRWLVYPQTREMGTGDVPGNSTFLSSNTTWVMDGQFGAARPATRTVQVPYPPAGFVPYQLVWPRWSFTYPGADFSGATVTMTRAGQSVAVALEPLAANLGEPMLVWLYDGNAGTVIAPHPKPSADTTYTVNVYNVRLNGAAQNFSYNVTVFDPEVAGADAVPVAVTGPTAPAVGTASTYAVAAPTFADSFDWRPLTLTAFAKIYSAENGLDGLAATTTVGYNIVQPITVGAGAAAYRLAHLSPRSPQLLVLPETFYVSGMSSAIALLSRLGIATSIEVAHVQVSTDDGNLWSDVFTQPGTSDSTSSFPASTEAAFVNRSLSLAAYAGRTVRVRLAFTIDPSGTAFVPTATNTVGWFIDNLTLTGVQSVTAGVATNVAGVANFSFTPAAAGALGLQARGVLFGSYPLEWGPVTLVTAIDAAAAANPGRIINLSILAPLAAGETMTLGTVLGGAGTSGNKALVARAAGPALIPFGVANVLPDPTLAFNSTSVSPAALVAANNNWGGSAVLSAAFAQVGAFAYVDATSTDAGIFLPSLAPGSYTMQVSDAGNGAGSVIAELYDATSAGAFTATTPRLINVSVLKQIAAGATLTAGIVIGGATARTVLIRAIGPGLAPFGVGGVMSDPQLTLNNISVSPAAVVATNNDWAGGAAIVAAATSVGAFAVSDTASKDAMLLVTLAPGNYTAQVSPASGTAGGFVIVEVYEVP